MFERISPLFAGAVVLACGCAAPRVPSEYPAGSAASARAEAAPAAPVAPMLRDDPPLPGNERANWQQWPGLDPVVESGHAGHGAAAESSRDDAARDQDHTGHGRDPHGGPATGAAPPQDPEHQHAH